MEVQKGSVRIVGMYVGGGRTGVVDGLAVYEEIVSWLSRLALMMFVVPVVCGVAAGFAADSPTNEY